MAELRWRKRSYSNWTPASYTADETATIITVGVGDMVGPAFCRVRVLFDGTNSDATASLGDAGDVDRFMSTATAAITATGLKMGVGGTGSTYLAIAQHLYTTADTLDVTFTKDTANDGTAGVIDWWVFVAQVDPH